MNKKNFFRILCLFLAVVGVSAATTFTVNRLTNNNLTETKSGNSPFSFADFQTARSGLETDFTLAAERTIHAVVHVKVKVPSRGMQGMGGMDDFFDQFFFGPFGGGGRQQQQMEQPLQEGSGSGVIISADGYIVTNNHVIENAKEIEVTLNDKRTFKAKLVGSDPTTDIALIKIEEKNLPTIPFGNSDSLKVGEWVLAVGNPFNLTSTVTAGIVSAKARNIDILKTQMKIESFIQTDAAINPGNSGGALVNTDGQLIGINTAIASATGSYAGYGFAVPSGIVQKVVTDIKEHGKVQRAVLGVALGDITNQLAKEKNLKTMEGAYVNDIVKGSAAEKAGIEKGDIITAIDGVKISSSAQLQELVGRRRPGDKVKINVLRGDKTLTLSAELKNMQGNTEIVSAVKGSEIFGATFAEVDSQVAASLNIEGGVQVKSVGKGAFANAGVKEGFIILKVNNQTVETEDDLQRAVNQVINGSDRDRALFLTGVYPNGRVTYYAVGI
ncbi:MAG: Do family serine endopeptidase [Prevotellaceae bacterium]|jgi:Do/DeqQ family serine protease|nr:Do family serine endopeptidase [Prevotellaceae bacterium]